MVHLHVRSCYSLLQGTLKIAAIGAFAKKAEIDALCLSDFQTLHGAMEFYHLCRKLQIKPLFGMEVAILLEEDQVFANLLAHNEAGYQELIALATKLQTTNQTGIHLADLALLQECSVILLHGGNYEKAVIQAKLDEVRALFAVLHANSRHFHVGLIHQESPLWAARNQEIKHICKQEGYSFVAVSRILYEQDGDESLLQVLQAMKQGTSLKTMGTAGEKGRYFRTKEDMQRLYGQEELDAAQALADRCTVQFAMQKADLPKFETPQGVSSKYYLRHLCQAGLEKRKPDGISKQYEQRLQYELNVIESMQFEDYFLVVWDYVRYAKSIGIQVGVGRGSAAGSLVGYVLGITHVDPLEYDLLFERFLNPERISMPDIDIDFPDHRRDEVIAYVKSKYGMDHVAKIITFGTLKARQVIRDVGKVLDISLYDIDMISKKIPVQTGMTLTQAYESVPALKQLIDSKKANQQLFQIALRLEGLPRHCSTHAAGIVIANTALTQKVPLIALDEDMLSTQYPMEYLEELGLLKMDFLGLRNLTIIDRVLEDVEETYHQKLDIMRLPLQDQKTLELVRNVDVSGIFQLESDGMRALLKKMVPVCFEDIVVTIALFRPGPMENIPEYLERRNKQLVVKLHPKLDPILQPTYGIMVYQEQIMQVAQIMAGFSLGKADLLRRAMSKKKESELLALKEEFIAGALQRGFEQKFVTEMYDLVLKFANYGFNKSHSVAYGMIAYQMAYLKANYPLAFFRALLNSVIGSEGKTFEYLEEAKHIQIQILYPCVNHSIKEYKIEEYALRLPLQVIRNVGINAMQEILKEREENGLYQDYFDFVARVNSRKVNRKVLESLIDGGALDGFRLTRSSMLETLEDALKYAELIKIEAQDQIRLDFNLVSKPAVRYGKESMSIRCEKEKSVLGFYLGTHPVTLYKEKLKITNNLTQVKQTFGVVTFLAQVQKIKLHKTKNGELMAFVSVVDEVDAIDIVCMPKLYAKHQTMAKGDFVYVQGNYGERDSVLVTKLAIYQDKINEDQGTGL